MANAQPPVEGANAAGHHGAPPPQPQQQPEEPPPYSDEVVPELPAPVPDITLQHHDAHESSAAADRPRTKPEGSAYASSYRPEDAADPPITAPDEHHGFNTHQIHNDAADVVTPTDQPPPAYTEVPGVIEDDSNNNLGAAASVASDGRINIRISQKNKTLTQLIGPQLQRQLTQAEHEPALPPAYVPEFLGGAPGKEPPPPLNVVIHVVGSRGDVQPFVALGKVLKQTYGHRVRLATHPVFKDFVTENGLEFFSIGGDPAELMAYMVKNPGLMPGFDTLRNGDVGKRRKGISEMLRGTWRSCIETGDGMGVDQLKQSVEEWMGMQEQLPEPLMKPFVADAIIANPPSFGHIHCAEKLGIPLHMMFTMPWSPTQQFPHPLANIQASNADPSITNFMSYILVDMLTWQGLGDVTNRFRKDSLGLDPISMIWAPAMLARLKIPWTYCWSPALIPKPKDWGHHVHVSGFYFLDLAQNFTPEPDLAEFLAAGEAPVYIGFGSIVVDDPNAMTTMIFEAVKLTGRRALVSKGWGGLGGEELGVPEGVFMLGNVPHDWLFKHVAAVVHHGGAGTTAAGIAAGRPTVVVPFFGDQPFWGAMTAKAGAGPEPIPYKDLTAEKLAEAIQEALKPESLDRAKELSAKIKQEQGSQNGAQTFHQMLKYDELRCAVAPKLPAVWRVKRTQVRLSAKAATVLAQEGELNFSELKLFRPREYETDEGPWDPFSGAASALLGTATQMMMGVADFPIETLKLLNIHTDPTQKKQRKERKDKKGKGKVKNNEDESTLGTSEQGQSSSATTLPGVVSNRSSSDAPELSTPGTPTTPTRRSTFVSQAMAASSEVSRPSSPNRQRRLCSTELVGHSRRPSYGRARSISGAELRADSRSDAGFTEKSFAQKFSDMNADSVVGTGKGIGRIVGAGVKSPLDFSLNIAKGFHNVPKLLGSEVRQVDKVTDFQSGLKTAAKEFGFGLYDGIAGIVTDPIKGAKKEGGVGFVKGVGRGIFNVPFRVMGGAWSVPAYAMKGLYQEMLKDKGANVQNYIIAARISQGYGEASEITSSERADIVSRWKCIRLNVKKKKYVGEEKMESLHNLMQERRNKKRDRVAAALGTNQRRHGSTPSIPASASTYDLGYPETPDLVGRNELDSTEALPGANESSQSLHHAHTYPIAASLRNIPQSSAADEKAELREHEAAIAASAANEYSRGNADEDELVTRAIRASMLELQREPEGAEDEEATLERVLTASLQEAQRSGVSEEEQRVLEETLRQSLTQTTSRARHEHGTDSEWDSSDLGDDEDYQRVIAESEKFAQLHQQSSRDEYFSTVAGAHENPNQEEEEALRKALKESEAAEKLRQESHANGDDEEALRKALEQSEQAEKQRQELHTNGDDEEALRKALEQSEQAEKARMEALEKQKTEEDIVMEYVKKQSLAEQQHRQRYEQGRDTGGESSNAGAKAGGASGN